MSVYRRAQDLMDVPVRKQALSHEIFHGLTPDEFGREAGSIADAQALTPEVRARLEAQLVERLKTPVDPPTWGPDWAKKRNGGEPGLLSRTFGKKEAKASEDDPLNANERSDAQVIARNMEKSRQVAHYKGLYIAAVVLTLVIALAAMFVDYQIIRGDIWTRALSNEFMVVPASLQSTVIFKSMQVIFAVLIVHFMLKITGVYGRNILVTTAFVMALVMIGCMGYLVAYNNMQGGTSTTLEHQQSADSGNNAIDQLFSKQNTANQQSDQPQLTNAAAVTSPHNGSDGFSFGLPKLSDRSLANTDSWFWLAFASVIFFIVTTVAALYLLGTENNIRNFHLARDYRHRQRQFAQLHLLEVADQRSSARTASRNETVTV